MGLHRIDLAFHGREIGVDVLHIGGYAGFILNKDQAPTKDGGKRAQQLAMAGCTKEYPFDPSWNRQNPLSKPFWTLWTCALILPNFLARFLRSWHA
jgi:hypothetical protein